MSKASTEEWEHAPEVPGSQMHELVHPKGVHAGPSRFTSVGVPVTWTPQQREVATILEGSVRIEMRTATRSTWEREISFPCLP